MKIVQAPDDDQKTSEKKKESEKKKTENQINFSDEEEDSEEEQDEEEYTPVPNVKKKPTVKWNGSESDMQNEAPPTALDDSSRIQPQIN